MSPPSGGLKFHDNRFNYHAEHGIPVTSSTSAGRAYYSGPTLSRFPPRHWEEGRSPPVPKGPPTPPILQNKHQNSHNTALRPRSLAEELSDSDDSSVDIPTRETFNTDHQALASNPALKPKPGSHQDADEGLDFGALHRSHAILRRY